jgi:hypothetical protein
MDLSQLGGDGAYNVEIQTQGLGPQQGLAADFEEDTVVLGRFSLCQFNPRLV